MKKIRLAIVGTGSIAFTHMYGIQRLDEAELVAIMEIHTADGYLPQDLPHEG